MLLWLLGIPIPSLFWLSSFWCGAVHKSAEDN